MEEERLTEEFIQFCEKQFGMKISKTSDSGRPLFLIESKKRGDEIKLMLSYIDEDGKARRKFPIERFGSGWQIRISPNWHDVAEYTREKFLELLQCKIPENFVK